MSSNNNRRGNFATRTISKVQRKAQKRFEDRKKSEGKTAAARSEFTASDADRRERSRKIRERLAGRRSLVSGSGDIFGVRRLPNRRSILGG